MDNYGMTETKRDGDDESELYENCTWRDVNGERETPSSPTGSVEDLDETTVFYNPNLEKYSSKDDHRDVTGAALVLLVFQGDMDTLSTVKEALNNGRPVVVMEGSGGAADYIAHEYQRTVEDVRRNQAPDPLPSDNVDEKKLKKKRHKSFLYLQEIVVKRHRDLLDIIHINEVTDTKEIHEVLTNAFLKAGTSAAKAQLGKKCWRLATEHSSESGSPQDSDLHAPMLQFLLEDSAILVKFLIESGINLEDFLTDNLRKLYDEGLKRPSRAETLFRDLLHKEKGRSSSKEENPLKKAIDCVLNNLRFEKDDRFYEDSGCKSRLTANEKLFIWAVLHNRQEIAKVFWRKCKDHIGAALTASTILTCLSKHAENGEDVGLAQHFNEAADEWEEIATCVMNECYQTDKEKAHKMLVRKIATWGNRTPFRLADVGEKLEFMSHSCCQTKLNQIWRGNIGLYTSMWKICLCVILPIAPLLIGLDIGYCKGKKNVDNKYGREAEPRCNSYAESLVDFTYDFYNAPVTKFWFHVVYTVLFLALFSFVLLTHLSPLDVKSPSGWEYTLWVWEAILFLEEVRQVVTRHSKELSKMIIVHFKDKWNVFDLVIHVLFIVSVVLRYMLTGDSFKWVRICYNVTLILCYLRTLQYFYAVQGTGPKVIMIQKMLSDLVFLGTIMFTVVAGYGVAVQNLRYPNAPASSQLIADIFYRPYFNIFGELFLEELDGSVGGCNTTITPPDECRENSWLADLLFACYMIFTHVLLLNLLVAMFSFTFQKVQDNSEKVWQFHRYNLVLEYYEKPALAPLFAFVPLIARAAKYIWRKTKTVNEVRNTAFRNKLSEEDNKALTKFEREGMEKYWSLVSERLNDMAVVDKRVANLEKQLGKQEKTLRQIYEAVNKMMAMAPEAGSAMSVSVPESSRRYQPRGPRHGKASHLQIPIPEDS